MAKLDWTEDLDAAGGLGNVVLYRVVADYPKHDDHRIMRDKMMVIGRVYAAAVTRGGGSRNQMLNLPASLSDHLAYCLLSIGRELDKGIASLNRLGRVDSGNLAEVVKVHIFLGEALVDGIAEWRAKGKGRKIHSRDSFVSKYLHFHAPMAVFIMDSRARNALKDHGHSTKLPPWPVDFPKELRTDYARHCLRTLAYTNENYPNTDWTPRLVDGHLLGYMN